MHLPTEQQCLDYFEQYKVPQNIFQHCLKVREVAVFLAKKLKEVGVEVNLELINCTALLHDLFKAVTLKELKPNRFHSYVFSEEEIAMWKQLREKYAGMYESEIAYEIFEEDYPEFALTLKRTSDSKNRDKTWEELIVHYADWRVFRNEVVSIKERLVYLMEKYPRDEEKWNKYFEYITNREEKIFSYFDFNQEELREKLENVQQRLL